MQYKEEGRKGRVERQRKERKDRKIKRMRSEGQKLGRGWTENKVEGKWVGEGG